MVHYYTKLGAKWVELVQTSSFVAFGWFHYCIKLSAKRAELEQLMQKFVPRSRIRIFGSGRTRSTPLNRKLMFWYIL